MTLRRARRRAVTPVLVACALAPAVAAPAAPAQSVSTLPTTPVPRITALAPGITYERIVREGRQVVHVVRARRAARVSLRPVLAGGSPTARGGLAAAVGANQDAFGAVAGVNGDFFNYATGNPSGVLMIDGHLIAEPEASRSALLVRPDGALDVAALSLSGRWQSIDPSGTLTFPVRTFQGINRSAQRSAEAILYSTGYGNVATPRAASLWEARIRLDSPDQFVAPGVPLTGVVVDAGTGGGTTIGRGHVVLTGVGSSGRTMARDLEPGRRVTITPGLVALPDMAEVTAESAAAAVGGGPLLVRDGVAVRDAGEGLTSAQTGSRTARTAVGETADGTMLLVTAEGFVQGSPGVTAAEQAELMAALGAHVAVAMDAGGSAQMALGTRPVVPWSGPRSLSSIISVNYRGLLMDETPPRISPNADRVDDAATITVRSPVAGRATVRLVHRTGRPGRSLWAGRLEGSSARILADPRALRLPDGIYMVVARLDLDEGGTMEQRRRIIVDRTLGGLVARPSGRAARQRLAVAFQLHRPARVTAVVRNSAGTIVARLAGNRPMRAGRNGLVWNRRIGGRPADGRYRVEVVATGAFGRSGLVREVRLNARP